MRCGNNSSLSQSQGSGNVFSSYTSSPSVSPFLFSSNQLDSIPKVAMRRRLSNTEQFSNRSLGSTPSLNMPPTNRLDFRRLSVSAEPLIQSLGSYSNEEKSKITRSYKGQSPHFIEEETDYTLLLSSKKLPSLDHGVDVKWEVSCSHYLY